MIILRSCYLVLFGTLLSICYAKEFYSLSAKDIFGKHVDFTSYIGKVVLIVNIPSECRFNEPAHAELQYLHSELSGLATFEILGFMSDDFGGLYPPCDKKQILKLKDKELMMQLFKKVNVIGSETHPVFKYLAKESSIKPNGYFFKYLIDHKGNLAEVYPPNISLVEGAYQEIEQYVGVTRDDMLGNMKEMLNGFEKDEKKLERDIENAEKKKEVTKKKKEEKNPGYFYFLNS